MGRLREYDLFDGALLIYDNATIHHADIVKEYLEVNEFNYKFTFPYSYMLKPIEFAFGKIKTYIRNETSNRADLPSIDACREAMRSITEDDLAGYYRHILVTCVHAMRGLRFD